MRLLNTGSFPLLLMLFLPALSVSADPGAEFERRFRDAVEDGGRMMELAAWCEEESLPIERMETLLRLLQDEPDHAAARAAMGDIRISGGWLTKEESVTYGPDAVWIREESRWGTAEEARRFADGERPVGEDWLPAAEAARRIASEDPRRVDPERPWRIRTPHYLLETTLPHARGREIAAHLEFVYHRILRRFRPLEILPPAEPMRVVVHRDKEAFTAALRTKVPFAGEIDGMFHPVDGTAYFYELVVPEGSIGTTTEDQIAHECAHQLFNLASIRGRRRGDVEDLMGSAWLIEGIPAYLESLSGGDAGLGDPGHYRIRQAPVYMRQGLVWSTLDFAGRRFPTEGAGNPYMQAAAMVHFFLHAEGGVYSHRLLRFLKEGRGRPAAFDRRLGFAMDDFDAVFHPYLLSLR